MTLDSVIDAYRKKLLTRGELFASLTALLSARPDDLATVRGALAFDPIASDAFEEWLEELKCFPVITLGDAPVIVSHALVDRLGPPAMPPARVDPATGARILTMAKVRFDIPRAERPRGVFGAQIRVRRDDGDALAHYSVVIRQVADVDAGEARDVAGFIGLVSSNAPSDALRGAVELFRNGEPIGVATISPLAEVSSPRRDRRVDVDFLEANP